MRPQESASIRVVEHATWSKHSMFESNSLQSDVLVCAFTREHGAYQSTALSDTHTHLLGGALLHRVVTELLHRYDRWSEMTVHSRPGKRNRIESKIRRGERGNPGLDSQPCPKCDNKAL